MAEKKHLHRQTDLHAVLRLLAGGHCAAVVGLSNYGKSELLRNMQSSAAQQYYASLTHSDALFVYVDCNRMLELSPRGFFEATLRAVQEALPAEEARLREVIASLYHTVVEPPNDFAAPLAFNDALVALVENGARQVILLLDEFEDVLTGIEPRILLNLRALRDKYGEALSYVISSSIPPSYSPRSEHVAEFAELFADGKHVLAPLSPEDARQMAADLFTAANDQIDEPEAEYLHLVAGGHPGLIQAVVRVLLQVESGAPQLYQAKAFELANGVLEYDRLTRLELKRLWDQLTPEEQQVVIDYVVSGELTPDGKRLLVQRGLIYGAEKRDTPRILGELFTRFARRKGLAQQSVPRGVWLDTDAGEVWVDGVLVPTLTDLEYRLLLLLYGRLDKICDKYQLVEAVWGEEYIDEVDDARIEKLVSRLRSKLEDHDSTNRYLVTVRGRGYKLSNNPE